MVRLIVMMLIGHCLVGCFLTGLGLKGIGFVVTMKLWGFFELNVRNLQLEVVAAVEMANFVSADPNEDLLHNNFEMRRLKIVK